MSRSENDRLGDIILASRRLVEIGRSGLEAYRSDWTLQESAYRQIEVVVEAYKNLSDDTQAFFGQSEREMSGMRVILAHIYWDVDPDVVWNVIADPIPSMLESATAMYQSNDDGTGPLEEDVSISPRHSFDIEQSSHQAALAATRDRGAHQTDKRTQILDAASKNPRASIQQIARIANTSRSYASQVLGRKRRRQKWLSAIW